MYKVYGSLRTRTFRILWMLEEIGADYELIETKPQSDTARAKTPTGKVPFLETENEVLTDSTAILSWLADNHGALTYPAGTIQRARQDGTMHRWLDEVDAVLWTAARHSFALPEEQRVAEVIPSLGWELDRNLRRIEAQLDGDFIAGDQMTIADIIATHCLNWAHAAGLSTGGDKLKAYSKAMRARPAYRRVGN